MASFTQAQLDNLASTDKEGEVEYQYQLELDVEIAAKTEVDALINSYFSGWAVEVATDADSIELPGDVTFRVLFTDWDQAIEFGKFLVDEEWVDEWDEDEFSASVEEI